MDVQVEKAKQFIGWAGHEKAHRIFHLRIDFKVTASCRVIDGDLIAADIGLKLETPRSLLKEMQCLRRGIGVFRCKSVRLKWGKKLHENGDQINEQGYDTTSHCQAVFSELPPDQTPLLGDNHARSRLIN